MTSRTVITGATGLVGRRLTASVIASPGAATVLSRSADRARSQLGPGIEAVTWDPGEGPPPAAALEGADVVYHLAGEPVGDRRWSEERKRRIRDSRVEGTRHLVEGLGALAERPRVLVSASAVGYYGDRGDELLTEDSPRGKAEDNFLAGVCHAWEQEALRATRFGIRVVVARLGVVLAPEGGALRKMRGPFRWGVGGRLGDGQQWMAWVHADDVVGLLRLAAGAETLSGALNVVAPNPARNAEFTAALGRALRRPTVLPVPRFALRAALGEMSEMLLGSQRVAPDRALAAGYEFVYPELAGALAVCT